MTDQLPGWGDRLAQAHDVLRQHERAAQTATVSEAGSTARDLAEQLRAHCQTVCVYVHAHHTSEDDIFFPHLERTRPRLAPALGRLRREHMVVDGILQDLEALTDTGHDERVRSQLDRLADELNAHFDYEEEHIVPVLNALIGPAPWETAH